MAEEKRRGRLLRNVERIKKFRLMDDIFMKEVLRKNLAGAQDKDIDAARKSSEN